MLSNLTLLFAFAILYRLYSYLMFSSRRWLPSLNVARQRVFSKVALKTSPLSRPKVSRCVRTGAHVGYKAILLRSVLLSQIFSVGSHSIRSMSTLPFRVAHDTIVSTQPTIIKRALDNRNYKALTLSNGMRVLLVSDPASIRSAAALDVHVGYFSDPKNLPGLAHFCEHMSFLGTKKYPEEEEFSSFLSTNGGSSNAYTDAEDTVYYFDVNAQHLKPALERFSQFFEAPLFTESATARELNAIESEHAKNVNNDGFRLHQLDRDTANPEHPLNRFATGNKHTLETQSKEQGMDVREELVKFHAQHYTANLMTLSVLGNQTLSELEGYVKTHFSGIPRTPASAPSVLTLSTGTAADDLHPAVNPADPALQWWGKVEPFDSTQKVAHGLEVVPIAESRSITLSWPVWLKSPHDRAELRRTKPDFILSHLIGHEGAGSLRSYLVKRGWVNYVQAYTGTEVSDCQVFDVHIDLTEEGHKHRIEVASAVFAYLDLLRHSKIGGTSENKDSFGIPSYLIDEFLTLSKVGFHYGEKGDPASYVSTLVANMQVFSDPSVYISGPNLFDTPDQAQIAQYLAHLTPAAARVMMVAPDFKNQTSLTGRFYGTEYNQLSMVEETKKWESVRAADFPELTLPAPNDLLPENFDLVSQADSTLLSDEEKARLLMLPPKMIRNDPHWQIWHKLDETFRQPKVHVVISLAVPADMYDADFVVKSRLFSNCFADSINEFLYDARLAGLTMELEINSHGVQLILSGYNDKMPVFAEKIGAALRNYQPDAATFERYKEQLLRELNNWSTQQPYSHASYYASLVCLSMQHTVEEVLAATHRTDLNAQQAFLPTVLTRSFGKALVIGNIDSSGAERLVQVVQKTLPFEPLPRAERAQRHVTVLPFASTLRLESSTDQQVVNVAVDGNSHIESSGDQSSATQVVGGYRLSYPEPNLNDDNSAASFYFQLPSRDPREYMYLHLLAEVLEQPFYGSLRTQQQLGYVVYSGIKNRENTYSLAFVAQSSTVDGAELTRRVEGFLNVELPEILDKLTQSEFEHFQQGIAVRRMEPDQRLTSQASRFWGELCAVDTLEHAAALAKTTSISADKFSLDELIEPRFYRNEQEVSALKEISLEDFKTFAREFLMLGGAKRRLLVSQITTAKAHDLTNEENGSQGGPSAVETGNASDSEGEEEEVLQPGTPGNVLDVIYQEIAGREREVVSNAKRM